VIRSISQFPQQRGVPSQSAQWQPPQASWLQGTTSSQILPQRLSPHHQNQWLHQATPPPQQDQWFHEQVPPLQQNQWLHQANPPPQQQHQFPPSGGIPLDSTSTPASYTDEAGQRRLVSFSRNGADTDKSKSQKRPTISRQQNQQKVAISGVASDVEDVKERQQTFWRKLVRAAWWC